MAVLFSNRHLLKRPYSPNRSVDLTEVRKAVFGALLKRAGSPLARLWSAELAECSESSQTARRPWITYQLQDRSSETHISSLYSRFVGNTDLSHTSSSRSAGDGLRLAFPSKMALKEFPRPALAIFAEHYRLRLRPRVGDVPLRMKAFHRFPVVRLPRTPRPSRR